MSQNVPVGAVISEIKVQIYLGHVEYVYLYLRLKKITARQLIRKECLLKLDALYLISPRSVREFERVCQLVSLKHSKHRYQVICFLGFTH